VLVADASGAPLDRRMRITRLGQGVDATGILAPEAVERTVAVLREYRAAMDQLGVERVRMTATSAARDAANREEFFAAAGDVVGVRPELLDGDEEGRLAFRGATADLDRSDGPFLVVDIGGGSTEFVVGTEHPEGVVSVDIGCVRLTEKFLHSDPPTAVELSQALSVIRDYLDDVARDLPASVDARRLVGLAGTVTTVAAVEQRLHNPGLEEARADVIVGGTAILVAVMRYFEHAACLVSEADILDGLVLSLLEGNG
jgi:exopolyphosphatase/guanosine-5'-triphosphate,3'-diphosphate pyrophosphatase